MIQGRRQPVKPVGPGLHIFGLITLPLLMNYALLDWGELKSLRAQSVGEVSAYFSCVQF